MNTKAIIQKYKELVEHLKAYYDAQNSPAVKLIHPQWENHLKALESELSLLQEQGEDIEETVSKEGLPIYDSEESGKELREKLTVRKFMLKKYPTNVYMDCPVPKEYWEVIQEYANEYLKSNQ